MTVVLAGTVMFGLDTTIVSVALHPIGVGLHAGSAVEWVVTSYLLALAASQPATGWLADRFGRRAMFLAALAVFTGASIACAAAPNIGCLVAFRAVQGFGGGALMPVGMAITMDLFPVERHGRAMAIWGLMAVVGPALGPTVGGWLTTTINWHWLFLINAPIGTVAFAAGFSLIPEIGHRQRRPFDLTGLVLGSGGLTLAILGLSEGSTWGWVSGTTITCLVAGTGALVAFVHHELATSHPMLQLRMFRERAFMFGTAASLFVYLAQYGRLVFIPLQLESVRSLTALHVGLLFLPAGAAQGIAMVASGHLVDRVGARLPMVLGAAMMLVAVAGFARLTLTTPLPLITLFLAIQGFGCGVFTPGVMVVGMSELPSALLAQGAAIRTLAGQVSGVLAVAVLGAIVSVSLGHHPSPSHAQAAYNAAFAAAAGSVLVGLVFAWLLPKRAHDRLADVAPFAVLPLE
ncbi:MAG TPA: DHA2 family efflux MFS transporter permease subunit [Acidimicrobiales bacterium]|nr:DHA2 family efflux MFS transporter permease subunit [Acidimicrobiales bacterium]